MTVPDPVELLEQVAAWYAARIQAERRTARVDQPRLADLTAAWRATAADRRALATASPEEAAAIEARYIALYRELTGA